MRSFLHMIGSILLGIFKVMSVFTPKEDKVPEVLKNSSRAYECFCGRSGWITPNKLTPPCPECHRVYKGRYDASTGEVTPELVFESKPEATQITCRCGNKLEVVIGKEAPACSCGCIYDGKKIISKENLYTPYGQLKRKER